MLYIRLVTDYFANLIFRNYSGRHWVVRYLKTLVILNDQFEKISYKEFLLLLSFLVEAKLLVARCRLENGRIA